VQWQNRLYLLSLFKKALDDSSRGDEITADGFVRALVSCPIRLHGSKELYALLVYCWNKFDYASYRSTLLHKIEGFVKSRGGSSDATPPVVDAKTAIKDKTSELSASTSTADAPKTTALTTAADMQKSTAGKDSTTADASSASKSAVLSLALEEQDTRRQLQYSIQLESKFLIALNEKDTNTMMTCYLELVRMTGMHNNHRRAHTRSSMDIVTNYGPRGTATETQTNDNAAKQPVSNDVEGHLLPQNDTKRLGLSLPLTETLATAGTAPVTSQQPPSVNRSALASVSAVGHRPRLSSSSNPDSKHI